MRGTVAHKLSLEIVANIAVIIAATTFIVLSVLGYYGWRMPGGSEESDLAAATAAVSIESVEGLTIGHLDHANVKASERQRPR